MAAEERGDEGAGMRPPKSHPKHPYAMKLSTLVNYWYDEERDIALNLWFPIDITGYVPVKPRRATFEPHREPDEEKEKWRWRLALPNA
jgi:hypothetical protein